MEFRKTIQLTPDDFFSYNLYAMKRMIIQMVIVIAVLVPALVYLENDTSANIGMTMVIALAIALPAAGLFALVMVLLLRRSVRKQFEKNGMLRVPNEYVLDASGVHVTSEFGNSNIPWQNIYRAAESEHGYYIYLARMQAFVLPKRSLSPEEQAALRAALSQYVEPKKLRLRRR
jgi:hypothetical protein